MESRAHVLLALLLLPTAAPAVVALNARAPPPLSRLSTSHSSAEVPLPPTAELTTLVINEEQTLVPSAAHGAMPFVSIDASNQTLNIHPAALHALASAPAPICVLSIAGGAQEGKSAWLNMFSHWLLERWPTVGAMDAGAPFKVGRSIFDDDSTQGAWLRVFTGKGTTARPSPPLARCREPRVPPRSHPAFAHTLPLPPLALALAEGRPLPGTECLSVALIDTQAPPRALSLDAGPASGAGVSAGAHKLFSLATLASSVVTLNVMSPALNLLGPLGAMLRDTQRLLLEPPAGGFVGELPNLVLLERDVLRPAASTAVLEYAMLEPRGDALDDARSAVRRLFHNRTLIQMAPPEAADLDAISRGEMPPQHRLRNLPLSGVRPFYAGFDAAASAAVGALRPKMLGGMPLHGRELAEALLGLTSALNEHAPASLAAQVYDSLRAQAKEAAEAAVRAGVRSLRRSLPSAVSSADALDTALPDGSGTGTSGLEAAQMRVPPVALVSASSLELALRNATQSALDVFAQLAPRYGSDPMDGEPAGWLAPYLRSVLTELGSLSRQARQAHVHAQRLYALARRERQLLRRLHEAEAVTEAAVESRVQQALAERLDERPAAAVAQAHRSWLHHSQPYHHSASGSGGLDDHSATWDATAMPQWARDRQLRQDLLSNLLLLALGASAAVCPPAALIRVAPLMASAPTVFALMGIYRLAQRPVAKAAGFFWGSVRSVSSAVLGAASRLTQRLDASLATLVAGIADNLVNDDFGQELVCGHSLRNVPCAQPA